MVVDILNHLHVDGYVELRKGLTLAEADDIKWRLRALLLEDPDIADVTLGILEDDDLRSWNPGSAVH